MDAWTRESADVRLPIIREDPLAGQSGRYNNSDPRPKWGMSVRVQPDAENLLPELDQRGADAVLKRHPLNVPTQGPGAFHDPLRHQRCGADPIRLGFLRLAQRPEGHAADGNQLGRLVLKVNVRKLFHQRRPLARFLMPGIEDDCPSPVGNMQTARRPCRVVMDQKLVENLTRETRHLVGSQDRDLHLLRQDKGVETAKRRQCNHRAQ